MTEPAAVPETSRRHEVAFTPAELSAILAWRADPHGYHKATVASKAWIAATKRAGVSR